MTIPFVAGKYTLRVWSWLKKALGIPSEHEREYAQPEQLADVMALIQVLALHHKYTHRGEDGLNYDLGKPRSVKTALWAHVADAHPEFFRVNAQRQRGISLIAPVLEGRNRPLATDLSIEVITRCCGAA